MDNSEVVEAWKTMSDMIKARVTRISACNRSLDNSDMSSAQDPLLSADIGMGKVRRRFLVVTVFDVCLTALLWVICTVTKGSDWPTVFLREVNIFQSGFMKISLFDIVLIAVCRTTFLLFFYALLLAGHWLPVAATTITTTLFLIVKALFFFSPAQGNLPQYTLIITSFMVAWFELWLVPFRMLPLERRDLVTPEGPLPTFLSNHNVHTEEEFRSAISGSESEEEAVVSLGGRVYIKAEYINAVERAESNVREKLADVAVWHIVNRKDPEIKQADGRPVYYIRDEFKCLPQLLFNAVWKHCELWNKQVLETKVILHIDTSTEVVYSISAPAMRGHISSRDFLDVRRVYLNTERDIYEGIYVSVDSSIIPIGSNAKLVRGTNGPNLIRVTRSETNPLSAVFEWIQESDVKCEIPKRLIARAMCSFLCTYVSELRAFLRNQSDGYP